MIPNVTGTQNTSSSTGTTGGGGGGTEGGLKKGPWTAAEDSILMEYVRKHGEGNWNSVQKNSGLNRCGKSCRLRWANHLRPNLKKGAFSPDEERTILELHAKFGNKWARMAAQLPGRTDNEIKNFWNTRIKRRQRQGLPLYPNDIHPLSAPTTPTAGSGASASAPATPSTFSAPSYYNFATQSPHFQSLSPLSSPNPLPFSPSSAAFFHREPPILTTPARFKSFNRSNGRFSLPLSPNQLPIGLIQSPFPQLSEHVDFQFSTHLGGDPMENLRPQFEPQHTPMSLMNSQLLSNQTTMASEAVLPVNHTGLFAGFFADSPVSHDDKIIFDGFNRLEDFNTAHFYSGESQKEEARDAVSLGQEDWSKLLIGIPPALQPEPEWYGNRGEISNAHSSNFAGNEVDLDLQNLTSFHQFPSESEIGRTPSSCPWDNLPGIQ